MDENNFFYFYFIFFVYLLLYFYHIILYFKYISLWFFFVLFHILFFEFMCVVCVFFIRKYSVTFNSFVQILSQIYDVIVFFFYLNPLGTLAIYVYFVICVMLFSFFVLVFGCCCCYGILMIFSFLDEYYECCLNMWFFTFIFNLLALKVGSFGCFRLVC